MRTALLTRFGSHRVWNLDGKDDSSNNKPLPLLPQELMLAQVWETADVDSN
jgi:hypothetical protein